jgi:hypothetical protein
MTYASVDPIISAWGADNNLVVFDSFADEPARFCYRSSEAGECFQIAVEAPKDGEVAVHVWSVETNDDVEVHKEWRVSAEDLRGALDDALRAIDALFASA